LSVYVENVLIVEKTIMMKIRSNQSTKATKFSRIPSVEELEPRCMPAPWTVTSLANDGQGSLRSVIQQAADGDTIQFAIDDGRGGVQNQGTIFLRSQIQTDKSLRIEGGPTQITINAGFLDRAFSFFNPTGPVNESISGITFVNGSPVLPGGVLGFGGAIRVTGGFRAIAS
jgi:hypothetical protein